MANSSLTLLPPPFRETLSSPLGALYPARIASQIATYMHNAIAGLLSFNVHPLYSLLYWCLLLLFILTIAALGVFLYYRKPPKSFPSSVPTVPFYVTFRPLLVQTDQSRTFEDYLRPALHEHGAANIFFGSRWNVLVSKPEYVRQIFKDEDTFAKSGNQIKIPYSVLAGYTGENIISATGERWKCYRDVIQPGLERKFSNEKVRESAKALVKLLLGMQSKAEGRGVEVSGLLQRYTMENLAKEILGVNFKTLEDSESPLHKLQLSVKREIFKPLFLSFPVLDRLPIPSRQRARELSKTFADALIGTLSQVSRSEKTRCHQAALATGGDSRLGSRLLHARECGVWTQQQLRHNMIAVFLAGHENPQLNLVSALYLLGKHTDVQTRLRQELLDLPLKARGTNSSPADPLCTLPYLASVTLEILRMYPPISQLINRCATQDVLLGGTIPLRRGTYVGYNCYSTHRDPSAWGNDADEFRPERWGSTLEQIREEYRRRKSRAEFISFHGGRRACLGEKYALMQFKATICELLMNLKWVLDDGWEERMTPAGPLYPMALRIRFQELDQENPAATALR